MGLGQNVLKPIPFYQVIVLEIFHYLGKYHGNFEFYQIYLVQTLGQRRDSMTINNYYEQWLIGSDLIKKKWHGNSRCGKVFGMWENLGQKSFRSCWALLNLWWETMYWESVFFFFLLQEIKGIFVLDLYYYKYKKEESNGCWRREIKHENYQQTKGVRISLHAYLTSVGWNKTPTIIVYQRLYSGPTKDSS